MDQFKFRQARERMAELQRVADDIRLERSLSRARAIDTRPAREVAAPAVAAPTPKPSGRRVGCPDELPRPRPA